MKITPLEQVLYRGHSATPCPYLPGREANLMFLNGSPNPTVYRTLLDSGYRRYGQYMYRPDCDGCRECQILRVPTETFTRSKEQRRIWNRGQREFQWETGLAEYSDERLDLYRRYLREQHQSSEADSVDEEQYCAFFVDSFLGGTAFEVRLYSEDHLVGVGILDALPDALSSVYFYFDPNYARLSPGTFSALLEIDIARAAGLPYYYLGYYIEACPSMSYKARFRPCEIKGCDAQDWNVVD